MKYLFPSAFILSLVIVSCEEQAFRNNTTSEDSSGNLSNRQQMKSSPYELHGIVDPGMNNLVAYAIQTPTSWKMQQSFTRIWNGSTPINQSFIRLVSPDQSSMIEFLPYTPYYYYDGPTTRSLRQTASAYGYHSQTNQGEMQPMYPLEYIKRMLLPQLAQRGLQIKINTERTLSPVQTSANAQKLTGYIDGIASNGKQVRVDCVINITTTNSGGETYYNWNVFPSVALCNGNVDAVYSFLVNARNSVKFNPDWERRNAQLVRTGNIANNDINRRNADMTRDYYNHIQKTGEDIADMRNKSSDRKNESFRDVIGGQAKYESAETGERVKLSDSYNHVYKDKQGNYYGSNSAMDNNQFDWEELQSVETKNY
ncbi:MAG: hypothetical protein ABI415_09135 [Flavitalea sp.]